MSDKKHHQHKDEEPNRGSSEAVETPESVKPSEGSGSAKVEIEANELEALRQKAAEAEAKSAENLDGWQRSVAEFQNYKKRIERDRESDKALMKGDLIKKVLPVLDDLERALKNNPSDSGADEAWAGIELIVRKLRSILEAEGVKRIEAQGAVFDPNFHEAISYESADGVESGRVIEIIQNGYMLGEHVVRPALVRVAK